MANDTNKANGNEKSRSKQPELKGFGDKKHQIVRGALNRIDSANYCSFSTRKLDELAASGELPRIKVGRKTLFRIADLDKFLESKIQRLKADPRIRTADELLNEGGQS